MGARESPGEAAEKISLERKMKEKCAEETRALQLKADDLDRVRMRVQVQVHRIRDCIAERPWEKEVMTAAGMGDSNALDKQLKSLGLRLGKIRVAIHGAELDLSELRSRDSLVQAKELEAMVVELRVERGWCQDQRELMKDATRLMQEEVVAVLDRARRHREMDGRVRSWSRKIEGLGGRIEDQARARIGRDADALLRAAAGSSSPSAVRESAEQVRLEIEALRRSRVFLAKEMKRITREENVVHRLVAKLTERVSRRLDVALK